MTKTDSLFIDGQWVKSTADAVIDVVNPATEEIIASVPAGTAEDADLAVRAAKRAFPSWSATPVAERADYIDRICDALEARGEEIVDTIVSELGMPRPFAQAMQLELFLTEARHHAEVARAMDWEEEIGNSLVIREAVGVVVAITPWNFPMVQVLRKVAPAVIAGCTVVVKPSENTPINAMILAEVLIEVGLPAGVVNIVTGYGDPVGEALTAHPDVDMISLTGSLRSGRRVAEVASQTVKRLALELGGKSAMVALDDADITAAVTATLTWTYHNSGQVCSALTRLLVPRDKLAETEAAIVEYTKGITVGAPTVEGVAIGPLVSQAQLDRVHEYIQIGVDEGARLLIDGREGLADGKGYYVGPTVFTDVKPGMRIEQEEIFGPVLVVVPYDTEAEAIEIANNTIYGLAAAVSTPDDGRARDVARQLRAGTVQINDGAFNPLAPTGGYKQSGYGRENGHFALEEFLEIKALSL